MFSQTDTHKPRGVLLFGLPGAGKTLIARTICGMLNIQPKIVRDPEIFSRFLGESEKKIRELFADARHNHEMFGNRSDVHAIIFDELNSVCKRRTHCDESTRDSVQDNVATQLLAEIDGLTPIDNILIIDTTNILSTIELALLRPGRIDMILEVDLPDPKGRLHIFDIHTKALLQNGLFESDVDVEAIIHATSGLTGAHIEKVVRLTIINAMRRDVLSRGRLNISEAESECLRVCNVDFKDALTKLLSNNHEKFLKNQIIRFILHFYYS